MKNTMRCLGIIALIVVIGFSFAACPTDGNVANGGGGGGTNQTPVADDFNIIGTGAFTYDGDPKTVTVSAKEGKTTGTVSVRYNGSPNAPSAVGIYTVVFDVATAAGWNAVRRLPAGTLTINRVNPDNQTPAADDFDISGTGAFTHDGDPKTVTVSAKEGKTTGTVFVTYTGGNGAASATAPSATGTYTVTFDVTESTGWNSASGLSAGTLTIIGIGPTTLIGITAEYAPATAIFTDTTLETLKADLTVTARYGDGSTAPVTDYTLSVNGGALTEGENTVTVSYTEGGITKTDTFTVTVNAAHVHNWSAISETPATCTEAGTETRECTAVSPPHFEIREAAAALGHNYQWTTITAPTCITAGVETGICARDAATAAREVIDPNAHDWEWTEITAPTATLAGEKTGVCRLNGTHTGAFPVLAPMVFVPGGAFQLGKALGPAYVTVTIEEEGYSRNILNSDTTPVSNVTLNGFYIGKYQVTQAQWQAVMGRTIQQQQALQTTSTTNYGRGDAHPMYYVNWYEAIVFCNKLSVTEGLTPAYRIADSANPDDWGDAPTSNSSSNKAAWDTAEIADGSTGYRLPTEAQWEYAAKGGNPLAADWVGYVFAGSDNPDEVAWYDYHDSPSHAVGTKAPNGLGLYDMSGNVREWCWDWSGNYTGDDKTDPTGPSSGSSRVIRGGAWDDVVDNVFSKWRSDWDPSNRYRWYGFRLARPAQ